VKRLVAFWNAREDPRAMELARLLVALVVLADLASIVRTGALDALFATSQVAGLATHPTRFDAILPAEPAGTHLLAAMIGIAAILFGLGRLPFIAGPALAFFLAVIGDRSPPTDRAVDVLLRYAILALAFVPSYRRCRDEGSAHAWPRRLLVVQVVLLYTMAGFAKLHSAWAAAPGQDAISLVLRNPAYVVDDVALLRLHPELAWLGTRLLVVFERSAPLLLFGPAFLVVPFAGRFGRALAGFRGLFVVSGIGFHLALAATTTLGIFPWGLLALYPCFVRGEELRSERARCSEGSSPRSASGGAGSCIARAGGRTHRRCRPAGGDPVSGHSESGGRI